MSMSALDDGEDFFSDDDFDAALLDEAERNAIQATQWQSQADNGILRSRQSKYENDESEDEDLDDAVIIDEARSTPSIIPLAQKTNVVPAQNRFRGHQQYGGTGRGSAVAGNSSQRTAIPPRLYVPAQIPPPVPQYDSMNVEQGSVYGEPESNQLNFLQKQIEELTKERNALQKENHAKAGEIAIVRSKQEKTAKDFRQELALVKKLNEEKLAQQKRALDAARLAERQAATDRDFMKQDLAEEVELVRKLRVRETEKKDVGKRESDLTATPRKKTLAYRDGFDDAEVLMLSPSKLSPAKFRRQNLSSPSRLGSKRKRKAIESPVPALDVIQDEDVNEVALEESIPAVWDEATLEAVKRGNGPSFIGMMLDHRPPGGQTRTIEELGKHALPSLPAQNFQSEVLGKIATLELSQKSTAEILIEFAELLISLWTKCMEENYLKPIYLFVSMLTLALELRTLSVAPYIIDNLLPVLQKSADLVAIPRFNGASPDPYDKDIHVADCLAILHLAALGCVPDPEHISRFWKLMRWDFVLLMLSLNQPTAEFQMMLRVLATSISRDSFGTLDPDLNAQIDRAGYTIDRLTYPISEVPYMPKNDHLVAPDILLKLRLQIVTILIGMAESPFAGRVLALHPLAIGRVVSLMSEEMDVLYDHGRDHIQSALLISQCTRLIYYLITTYDSLIDIQKKLAAIPGGFQKYLICLARLNFSEDDLLLERDIDADVAGYALELLELAVTPDEGDAIHEAFGDG